MPFETLLSRPRTPARPPQKFPGAALRAWPTSRTSFPHRKEWSASRRKELPPPDQAGSWAEVHQKVKVVKIGYRRQHPDVPTGPRVSDAWGKHMSQEKCGRPPSQTSSTGTAVPSDLSKDGRSNPDSGRSTWAGIVRDRFTPKSG